VLAAQYESLTLPIAIILIVPMACWAMTGVWLSGGDNNVFTQIGLIVLVGLSAKNAILIVEFARELEFAGRTPVQAAIEASRLRLRPILMTSLALSWACCPWCCPRGRRRDAQRHGRGGVRRDDRCDGLRPVPDPVFYVVLRRLAGNRPLQQHGHHTAPLGERELHGGPAQAAHPAALAGTA
jgi:multidrug efflux pump